MFGLKKLLNRTPTRGEFAKLALDHLKQKCPTLEFTFIEEQFLLQDTEGRLIYLINYFDNYVKSEKPGRAQVLERLVLGAQEPPIPNTLDEVRQHLLPVLRNLPGLECTLLDTGSANMVEGIAKMGMTPFVNQLSVGVAYDADTMVYQVGTSNFSTWGIGAEEALAIALDNLRHKAAPSFRQVIPGTYIAQYGDHYDAARILLPELAWQLTLTGNPVAMIPTRDCLVITGEGDETGQALMLALAQQAVEGTTRHLTGEMFRLEDSQWKVWQPSGACAAEHRKLSLTFLSGYYEAQQASLVRALAAEGNDVFVASYKAMQKQTGELFTFATLTQRLPTLLPETELVVLVDPEASQEDSPPVVVPWKVLQAELGPRLEPLEYNLPRYKVYFDPSAEEMEKLRQQAVSLG